MEIELLTWAELESIHKRQLELFGGQDGYTDKGVVESAFNRARWAVTYGEPDIAELAAEYWFGLARTQGFSDGNKLTATHCMLVFLGKNGYRLKIADDDLYPVALAIAMGEMDRD